jgi:hypothetical protein
MDITITLWFYLTQSEWLSSGEQTKLYIWGCGKKGNLQTLLLEM